MGATELTSHLCAHLFTQAHYRLGEGEGQEGSSNVPALSLKFGQYARLPCSRFVFTENYLNFIIRT